MNRKDAEAYLGRHVKISPYSGRPHFRTGIIKSIKGDKAIVIVKGKDQNYEDEIQFQHLKRWNRGEQIDAARLGAIAVATVAAEKTAENLIKSSGMKTDRAVDVYPSQKLRDHIPRHGESVGLSRNKLDGTIVADAPKLADVRGAEICEIHGWDMPCGDCAAAKAARDIQPQPVADKPVPDSNPVETVRRNIHLLDAFNGNEQVIILDKTSGRVFAGGGVGFIDAVADPQWAINRGRRYAPAVGRRVVTDWLHNGSDHQLFFSDGLEAVTAEKALDILTEPGRKFRPASEIPPVVKRASINGAAAPQTPSKAPEPVKTAPDTPPAANTLAERLAKLAKESESATHAVRLAEENERTAAAECKRLVDLLTAAKANLENARASTTKAREALGKIKAKMMEEISKFG